MTDAANHPFKPGDVVQVISGGPRMTVTEIGEHLGTPTAWCVWFEGQKQMDGTFPIVALKLSTDPKPTPYTARATRG
jgi:uncharacterized protein YodC (DUF2158 family)